MRQPKNDMPDDGREHGWAICEDEKGRQTKGPEAVGHRYGVSVDIACPRGYRPVGLFHSHPGGRTDPSQADLSEARRLGIEQLCIGVPDTGEIKCHRIARRHPK